MTSVAGANPLALTTLEIACGMVFGLEPDSGAALPATAASPLEALEEAVLPALARPPCIVSFSGGRDSSAVLAVAAHVARREGLQPPVPATNRFPRAPETDESEWQELVVAHLRLGDWLRREHDDELDAVGPVATRLLRRHGLLWPFNVHFHEPLLEEAAGGSLLTGVGGDEVFGGSRWARALSVLSGRVRPVPRDLLALGLAFSPTWARARVLRRRHEIAFEWLRPKARRAATRAWAAGAAAEPLRLAARLAWWRRQRYLSLGTAALDIVAADHDVAVVHPFAEPQFLGSLARETRFATLNRARAMESVLGELLPGALYRRETKVCFDEVFWNRHSRSFTASWQGEGVDPAVVDAEALRRAWAGDSPDPHVLTLLQAAWVARESARSVGDHGHEPVGSLAE